MKIVYIHQYFCTPKGSSGTRSYDVSRHLVQMGHQVTMICGILDIGGINRMPWYKIFKKEKMDGFDVVICNAPYSNHMGPVKRAIIFLWFSLLATIAGLAVRKPDLVFATSTPLTVGVPGYLISIFKHVPFVFEIRDIWPEAFVISGRLKPSFTYSAMKKLEEFIYAKAKKILLVSPGFENRLLERGYPKEKLKTVLLGADGELFKEAIPDTTFRSKYALENKLTAIFTGAHGISNGLDYLVDAAEHLKHRNDIIIVLLGEGKEKQKLKNSANQKKLSNILFLNSVPKTEMVNIVSACDVGLMILSDVGQPRPVTPNKIFDYMFAGLPSIVNFPGCTLDMVLSDKTGIGTNPHESLDLARKLEYWADHPEEREEIGRNARKIAYEKYTRIAIARQLAETFEEVIENKGHA